MLSIISLNTWKCDGDYDNRLEIMRSQLKKLNYSVIALQECFATTDYSYNTAQWIAEGLQMNCFFYPIRRKERLVHHQYLDSFSGLAILSKFPFDQKHVIDLPSTPEDPERAAIAITFLYNNVKITIANLHLTHIRNSTTIRNQQFKKIVTDDCMNDAKAIRLFCGDFNCEISSESLSEFFKPPYNLKDTYDLGDGVQPCYTCPVTNHFPLEKRSKIDHILVAPFNHEYPSCQESQIELNNKDQKYQIYPSDHFAVSTKILI